MPREERDFFDQERLRKFRLGCAGCVVMMGMYLWMILGSGRSVTSTDLYLAGGVVLLVISCIGLGYWKLRSPAHHAPNIVAGSLGFLMPIAMMALSLNSLFEWIVRGIPTFSTFAGLAILAWGFMSKRGEGVYCTACKYEKAPGSGPRCSECGTRWDRPGATTVGLRRVHRARVTYGALIACAGVGTGQLGRHYRPEIIQRTPISMLAAHFPHASDNDATEIAKVLEQRTLTPAFVRSLATSILDARREAAFRMVSRPSLDWLIERWIDGTLDDDTFERYVRETGAISVQPPNEPRVSHPAILTLVDQSRWGSTRYPVRYILESLTLEDGTQLLGLADEARFPGLLNSRFSPEQRVEARFTPTEPGPRRATLSYWLVLTDGLPGTLQWNQTESGPVPDFVPEPNTKPILWLKRYESTLDFKVAP